jgi:hypothetical protein
MKLIGDYLHTLNTRIKHSLDSLNGSNSGCDVKNEGEVERWLACEEQYMALPIRMIHPELGEIRDILAGIHA